MVSNVSEHLENPAVPRKTTSSKSRVTVKTLAEWSAGRQYMAMILENKKFDSIIGAIILANSIVLVLETDQRADCKDPDSATCVEDLRVYTMMGTAFLVIYTIELILKLWTYRMTFWGSSWNNFDFLIVTMSWLSEVTSSVAGADLPAISVARVFRAIRLAKVFRVLMVYKELYLIIYGFMSAMRAIFWASALMFFLLTIWSIFAVEILNPLARDLAAEGAFGLCTRCERAYETVMSSNLTFLQTIIAGDSWGVLAIPIIEKSPATSFIFIGIFATVVLGFSNLILAVIVDCAADARQDDLDYQARRAQLGEEAAMQHFVRLCKELDQDGSGALSLDEFVASYDNSSELANMLKAVMVERKDLPMLFHIMDDDGSGTVDYVEFANNIHKMKTSESWTSFTFLKYYLHEIKQILVQDMKAEQQVCFSKSDAVGAPESNEARSGKPVVTPAIAADKGILTSPAPEPLSCVTASLVEKSDSDTRSFDEMKLKLDEMSETFKRLMEQPQNLSSWRTRQVSTAEKGSVPWSLDSQFTPLPTAHIHSNADVALSEGSVHHLGLGPSNSGNPRNPPNHAPVQRERGFEMSGCSSCSIAQDISPKKPSGR